MAKYRTQFARKKIKVQGIVVEVLILGKRAELTIDPDLSQEMDRVAAQLGYWGSVLASAKKERIQTDSSYRSFRARGLEQIIKKDSKLAFEKAKALVEALAGFSQFKEAIAQAEENVELCQAMVDAFDKKGNVLQSKGAYMRDVMKHQGKVTPEKPRGWNLSGDHKDDDDDAPSAKKKTKKKKKKKRRQTDG